MTSTFPSAPDNILNDVVNGTAEKDLHPTLHNKLADAINAVQSSLLPGGALTSLTVGSGDERAWVTTPVDPTHLLKVLEGTNAAPVTAYGPSLKVVRTVAIPGGVVGDGVDRVAAIQAQAHGTSANQVQPIGVFAWATSDGTAGVNASGDACGVYGMGTAQAAGVGMGLGGFFLGTCNSITPGAKACGLEVDVQNAGTGTVDHSFNPTGFPDTCALAIYAAGPHRAGCAVYIDNGYGQQFDVGIGFARAVNNSKTGAIVSAAIRDDSVGATTLLVNGTHTNAIDTSGATLSGSALRIGGGQSISSPGTIVMAPTTAIEQRNGTNAQQLSIYNTYTDASNYERLAIAWTGNICQVLTQQAGTGVSRSLWLGTSGATSVNFVVAGSQRWQINNGGHFLAVTDNAYDIGIGGFRPRNLTLGGLLDAPLLTPTGNVVEQRNGVTAQTLRIFGTYTDASNYERLTILAGATCDILAEQAGTGGARNMRIGTGSTGNLVIMTQATGRWRFDGATGSFYAQADNTYDIGTTGARPRNLFVGGAVATGVKAGAPVDADVNTPTDGMIRLDSTNNRIYARVGGAWRYAALT
jgi:hypothetical protein